MRRDAGPVDSGAIDGDVAAILVDGVIGASEWSGVLAFPSSTVPDVTFDGNALRSLRAFRNGTRLFVAVEGSLMGDNAFLVYVDAAVGAPEGLLGAAPLLDLTGILDRALSKSFATAPTDLRIDFAWGTLDMNRAAIDSDDRMGWRGIAASDGAFVPVPIDRATSVCGEAACETSIDLTTLGADAATPVGIFVRLGSATNDLLSNQTLPMDDPAAPETVTIIASVP
jgi:hypothetical protein